MIELKAIEKKYQRGAEHVHALRGIDLTIDQGEFVSVTGPSGSGKTTMLHILGCLDHPTHGTYRLDGVPVEGMVEGDLIEIRRGKIGFVFQQFHLLPKLSVMDNVTLPLLFARKHRDKGEIAALLERVGLGDKMDRRPNELSGGEMQRVAIARALVNRPELILADEPTGNLDTNNSERIFSLLQSLHRDGITVVMVTHNPELARRAERIVRLQDGIIV